MSADVNHVAVLRRSHWDGEVYYTAWCNRCQRGVSSDRTGHWASKASAVRNAQLHIDSHAERDRKGMPSWDSVCVVATVTPTADKEIH